MASTKEANELLSIAPQIAATAEHYGRETSHAFGRLRSRRISLIRSSAAKSVGIASRKIIEALADDERRSANAEARYQYFSALSDQFCVCVWPIYRNAVGQKSYWSKRQIDRIFFILNFPTKIITELKIYTTQERCVTQSFIMPIKMPSE